MVKETVKSLKMTSEKFTVSAENRKLFGERLKLLIKERGVTQDKFAEIIGVSSGTVKKWVAGLFVPGVDELQIIYEKFNASLDWLVLGIETPSEFLNPYLPIDSLTLEEIIEAVGKANVMYKITLTTAQRAKIYTILYDEKMSDKKTNILKRAMQLLSLLSLKD